MINNLPFVSVILPVRNEEKRIKGCLEAISNQSYPKEKMEVLIIDGMSEDRTRQLISPFGFIIIDNPKKAIASACNIGIKNAKGDIIVRVDARVRIPKDYIRRCVKILLETGADNAGGKQEVVSGSSLVQEAAAYADKSPFGRGNNQRESGWVNTVYLGCFRKEIFEKVGLFDEDPLTIPEDTDMDTRIIKSGGRIYFDNRIISYYCPRDNFKDLWKLYFVYGGAAASYFIKHKKLSLRKSAPILLLPVALFLVLLSLLNNIFVAILGFAALAYLFLDVYFSAKKPKLFPILLAIFPLIHFSWSLAFYKRLATIKKKTIT